MEALRAVLRQSLGKSLRALNEQDRIAAAWAVAAGRQMGARGTVAAYEAGVVRIDVIDPVWQQALEGMRHKLASDMAQIAGLPVREIRFVVAPWVKSRL